MKIVRIQRANHFNGRGLLRPFSWLYSLSFEGFKGPVALSGDREVALNYEGQPLAEIRKTAKRIATENGASVVQAWVS